MKRVIIFLTCAMLICQLAGCNKDDGDSGPPSPVASFEVLGDTISPALITFTNTSTNADSFHWDFGNDSTSTLISPTITYRYTGLYTVTLVAIQSETGKTDTATQTMFIHPGEVSISEVFIEAMPFTRPEGGGWDLFDGPDVYVTLARAGQTLYTTGVGDDITADRLPINFFMGITQSRTGDFISEHQISIYDNDSISDQLIARFSFSYGDLIATYGYQDLYTLEIAAPAARISIDVIWY